MNAIVANQSPFPARPLSSGGAMVEVESQRAIQETQAAMVIAKRFPRDQAAAMDRVLQACTRPSLAESAMYQYSRGGTDITGPSIRMAETLAREWGNMQYGIRELTQANGESEVEAFCWDIETNTRQVKVFKVPHVRFTRQGSKRLEDPRDIYEMVANQGARRLRACILGVIPGDVVDAAMEQCEVTLKTKIEITPDTIKGMLEKFAEYGVTKVMIEKRLQRNIDSITPAAFLQFRKIYTSLKDGMGSVSDFFDQEASAEPAPKGTAGLKAAVAARAAVDPQDDALRQKEGEAAIVEQPAAAPAPAAAEPEKAKAATRKPAAASPKFSYAHIADKLNAATTPEECDNVIALVNEKSMEDPTHIPELTELYQKRRFETLPKEDQQE